MDSSQRRPSAGMVRAKAAFLERIRMGASVPEALAAAGRSESTYENWRRDDPGFAKDVALARDQSRRAKPATKGITFEEFCAKYLKQPLHWHQQQWADLLDGKAPRDLNPAQVYEAGDPNYVLVNTPPEHAKTATLSINYVTFRVVTDPNVRIILVSKTQERAKEFLYAVKQRLTHPGFKALQDDFGPSGGWREDAAVWTADRIYLGSERDSGEKDPTVQAIGIGGQIYGARSDLIIIDDGIVLSNAHMYEQQLRWVQQEVITRLGPTGKLLIVGTRVDATDLYRVLRDPDRYPSGESPWTYLSQPAVLSYADRPEDWTTLWPRAQVPWDKAVARQGEDGLFPRWDGPHLSRRRAKIAPRTWALAYMQADVEEDSTFSPVKVRAAVNGMRHPGLMRAGAPGHRPSGMAGLYVIASMDPAMKGDTGVIVMGVDRYERRRYVLDVRLRTAATPAWIRQTIQEITDTFGVAEWRVESNAFQSFLTQDEELRRWLADRGVLLAEHVTGRNKWDVDFGVASMAVLFDGLIELPSTSNHEPTRQLIEQLTTWSPETKAKTDLVMALWFAEIRAREIAREAMLGDGTVKAFMPNRFLSPRRKRQQQIINLNDLAASRTGVFHAVG